MSYFVYWQNIVLLSCFLRRQLRLDVAGKHFETAAQKTVLVERRTRLMRMLARLRSIQQTYMPAAIQVLSKGQSSNETTSKHAEDVPIIFPSDLPLLQRSEPGCRADLVSIEEDLREAQLRTSLQNLRTHLHMKSRLLTYRKTNVKAQGMVTKSQSVLNRNQRQICLDTTKYQDAWTALRKLRGKDKISWRKLMARDVRMMDGGYEKAVGVERKRLGKKKQAAIDAALKAQPEGELSEEVSSSEDGEGALPENAAQTKLRKARAAVGEGYRHVSWIWMEGGTGRAVDKDVLDSLMRVEWSKCHARRSRWSEEVNLLTEEMKRCLLTLEFYAREWEGRVEYTGPLSAGKDTAHAEGVRAYAQSQASIYRRIAEGFGVIWNMVETEAGIMEDDEGEKAVIGDIGDGEDGIDGVSEDEEEEEAELDGWDDMADIPEGI